MGCVPSTENGGNSMRRKKPINQPAPLCGGSVNRSADFKCTSFHSSQSRGKNSDFGNDASNTNDGLTQTSSKPRLLLTLDPEPESGNTIRLKHNKWPNSLESYGSNSPSTDESRYRLNLRSSSYVKAIDERLLKVGKLGKGGSASVFLTVDYYTLKLVAVKVVSTNSHRLINHEVAALRSQRTPLLSDNFVNDPSISFCPYISRFYGCNVNKMKKQASIAMEYECCGSLEDWAKEGLPTPEPWLAHIAYSVLKALHFIHNDMNRVHRDVKPGNILLSDSAITSMSVKLADFGTAVNATSNRSASDSESFPPNKDGEGGRSNSINMPMSPTGTQRYMAPERLALDGYSFNSDVWSVGLTLATVANKGECPLPHTMNEFDQLGVAMSADVIVCGKAALDNSSPMSSSSSKISYAEDSEPGLWDNDLSSRPSLLNPDYDPSPEFRDFLRQCLISNYQQRPDAGAMLSHPFLMERAGWEEACPDVLVAAQKRREQYVSKARTDEVIDLIVLARLKAGLPNPISSSFRPIGFTEFSREFCVEPVALTRCFEQAALKLDSKIEEKVALRARRAPSLSHIPKATGHRKFKSCTPRFSPQLHLEAMSTMTVMEPMPISIPQEETVASFSDAESGSTGSEKLSNKVFEIHEEGIDGWLQSGGNPENKTRKTSPLSEESNCESNASQSEVWKSIQMVHQESSSSYTVGVGGAESLGLVSNTSIGPRHERSRRANVWRVLSDDSDNKFDINSPQIDIQSCHREAPSLTTARQTAAI